MNQKTLFLVLTIALLAGTIIQKSVWGGSFSVGMLMMAAVSGWCAFKNRHN